MSSKKIEVYRDSIWKKDVFGNPIGVVLKRFVFPVLGMTFGIFVFNYSLGISLEYDVLYPHIFSGLTICFFTITYFLNVNPYRTEKGKRIRRLAALTSGALMFASILASIISIVWWNFIK